MHKIYANIITNYTKHKDRMHKRNTKCKYKLQNTKNTRNRIHRMHLENTRDTITYNK